MAGLGGRGPTRSTVSSQSGQTVRVSTRIVSVQPGETIGRFTVLDRLGSGAMGAVYSAYDPKLDRKIALKLLHTRSQDNSSRGNTRLLREAQAMARLSHPNVVVVHDVGTHRQDVFLAMEFIRGKTLQAWSEERPRSWQEVVATYRQAGAGLAAAHAAGLVHRDFKPANAMVGEDGRVRVLDFGLCATTTARIEPNLRAGSGAELPLWVGREFVGTPAYMSPEQFRAEVVGAASDQFSFCVALYEALYGQRPFAGETTQSIALSVGYGECGHRRRAPTCRPGCSR
nr:serine/threonine-protein kinase [Nannocystis pusilla]